uniref:Uncharacterized protein n=1 Tax=Tanacetum cinerariifolium TaxID=118510 RepID=A0A6L2N640_TANCI|nr:hypothetical protein [Tanacetum cinerariifolium]
MGIDGGNVVGVETDNGRGPTCVGGILIVVFIGEKLYRDERSQRIRSYKIGTIKRDRRRGNKTRNIRDLELGGIGQDPRVEKIDPVVSVGHEGLHLKLQQHHHLIHLTPPSTSHAQSPPLQSQSPTSAQTHGAHFPMSLLQEALDACAALARRVEHLEQDKVAQDLEIIKLKTRVQKLEKINKAKTLKLRRLRKVGTSQRVDTSDDTLMEDVSNQGRVIDRDEDAVKEADKGREYTADTQVERRQADIYHIDMDHAAKVLSMQEDESEVQEAVETISVAAAVPTVTAPPVKVAAPVKVVTPVKADVPSTRQKGECKSDASKGFDQIIDFLNGSYIAYALTVNPTIYVSCIKQLWRTVVVKSSNDVTMLQALLDKKRFVVTEAEALDACAALARRVEHLEQDKVAQDLEIIKLKTRVQKLEKINKAKTLKLRRLRKVGTSQRVDTSDDTLMEDVSNQGRVIDRDEDAVKEADKGREYTADTQVERRQADIYHIDMDHAAKVLSMQEDESEVQEAVETISVAAAVPTVTAPPVKVAAPVKVVAPVKAAVPSTRQKGEWLSGIQRRNHLQKLLMKLAPRTREKTSVQKAAKRRKLIEEAKKAKSIKQHFQIVPDEDDDVFTEAIPLARKVPVVDYQIILLVKRRYPLTKFTLEQMLNVVRLQVEEENEMSLELIRFTRQQL